jgi:hypothetical protein
MNTLLKISQLLVSVAACMGVLIVSGSDIQAANYYVSPSGSDSSSGSESSPWRTIQKCADTIGGGDTCIVRDGTYTETIAASRSGSDGNPIYIKAEFSRQVTVNGTITLSGRYIRIEGFKMVLPAGQSSTVAISGDYNQVAGFYFDTPSGTPGRNSVALHVAGNHNLVEGNYAQGTCFGINLFGTYNTIERNEVTRLKDVGDCGDVDYMRFFGTGHVIRNNSFHGIVRSEVGGAHVDCFQSFDNNGPEYSLRNVTIENNFCADCDQGSMLEASVHGLSDGLIFRNNVFKNCAAWGLCVHQIKNVRVYNNTFDMTGGTHGMGCRFGASCEVKNNIFYNGKTAYWFEQATILDGTASAPGKNNLSYSVDRFITGYSNDVTNKDPLFVNRSVNNYTLQSGSPAIDAGRPIDAWVTPKDRNGISRPQGRTWDIGAHEYSTTYVAPASNLHVVGQ